jgi:hypothetical protein
VVGEGDRNHSLQGTTNRIPHHYMSHLHNTRLEEDRNHSLQGTTNRIPHHYTSHLHNTQMEVVGEDMYHNQDHMRSMFPYYHMYHPHNKKIHIVGDIWIVVRLFPPNDDNLLHTIGGFGCVALVRFYMILLYNDL